MKYNIRVVSSYPPRLCGIATYAENKLGGAMYHRKRINHVGVTAIDGHHKYNFPVDSVIQQYDPNSWIKAAKEISAIALRTQGSGRTPTIVDVNHEFGLGGRNWDRDDNYTPFLESLRDSDAYKKGLIYILTTLHTIRADPNEHMRKSTQSIIKNSDATIVLSSLGKDILFSDRYSIDPSTNVISHIEHGVRMNRYTDEEKQEIKRSWGLDPNTFTFVLPGLISPGKGIYDFSVPAYVLAVEELNRRGSNVKTRMLIRGRSHPDFEKSGSFAEFLESSRSALKSSRLLLNNQDPFEEEVTLRQTSSRTRDSLHGIVQAYRSLTEDDYSRTFAGGDVPVFAYPGVQQISSGQVVEAMGHGTAPITTKFWHAVAMLAPRVTQNLEDTLSGRQLLEGEIIGNHYVDARGLLVDCNKGENTVKQIAECMVNCVTDEEAHKRRSENAREKGQEMTWDKIFEQNIALVDTLRRKRKNN